jgi:hypothetical protein
MRTLHPVLTLALSTCFLTVACGKQGFVTTNQVQQGQAPGSFVIQPKVDLVLLLDDSGSAIEPQDQIQAQARRFLKDLDAQGWNFHFTTSSLNNAYASGTDISGRTNWYPYTFSNQVTGSRHDLNYYSGSYGMSWLAPYPGANPMDPLLIAQQIASAVFIPHDRFSQFPSAGGASGSERGIGSIVAAISGEGVLKTSGGINNNFFRKDALLAIVPMSNGDDDSTENWRSLTAVQRTIKLQDYANKIIETVEARGGQRQKVRTFAAVAQTQQANGTCLGNNSFIGSRYNELATIMGGSKIDLCTEGVSGSLSRIATELQALRQSYVTRYVFLNSEPEPGTIRVKIIRENGSVETLAEGATPGFDYANSVEQSNPRAPITRATLETPDLLVQLNNQTGFAIRLNGTAILRGNDRTQITYKDYGTNNSN